MFVTSKILQGHRWVTGGQHHWDEYYIGSFNGTRFSPHGSHGSHGVLDYGYVAAGKTAGNAANDPAGRRTFFGWNMPWSRQGADGQEGPWRRQQEKSEGKGVVWPTTEPFGSQVLPRDLSLFPDGTLRMVPVPELSSLRMQPAVGGDGHHFHAAEGSPMLRETTACLPYNRSHGRQLEVNFTINLDAAAPAQVN